MHHRKGTFLVVGLVVGAFAFAGCKPSYPNCDSDDHCKEQGEVCVNKQCQECRDDTQCQEKYPDEERECVSGRCEVKPECVTDPDCSEVGQGLVCRGGQCVPECTADADCPAGRTCVEQKCIGECEVDIDCGPGRVCDNGVCKDAGQEGMQVSANCRPMNPTSGDVVHLDTVSFEFDKYDLTVDARDALNQNAECLRQVTSVQIIVEGHCDQRGTEEYNLALGEKRANTVRSYLKNLGVDPSRLRTRSKGENEPVCMQATEDCYFKNRRVEFIQKQLMY